MKTIKNTLIGLLSLLFLISCSDEKINLGTIEGKWKLTEQYIDPGDGSGDFTPVNSSRAITFNSNGTFTSNGDLCELATTSNVSSNGIYNEIDKTITINDCSDLNSELSYSITNNKLIVSYTCIEVCQHKYTKVSN